MSEIVQPYRTESGHELPGIVTPDGRVRLLGALPSNRLAASAQRWGASKPIIPRSDWQAFDRKARGVPILDQGQHGSCVGHGSATALMRARARAGQTFQRLSACFIYAQINGGRDQGANLSDAMQVLTDTGACLESEVPEGMIYKGQIPASAYETAKRFKATDVYSCDNFDETVSAALMGYDLFLSIYVGNGFNNLDADGCPPAYRAYGNHCTAAGDALAKSSRWGWVLDGINSWSEQWGRQGHYGVNEQHVDLQPGYIAYAVKAVADDPSDPTNPPVVVA